MRLDRRQGARPAAPAQSISWSRRRPVPRTCRSTPATRSPSTISRGHSTLRGIL